MRDTSDSQPHCSLLAHVVEEEEGREEKREGAGEQGMMEGVEGKMERKEIKLARRMPNHGMRRKDIVGR